MNETLEIYCCGCEKDVTARLTSGKQVYSHLPELAELNFWQCPSCENFVGCHKHKPKQPLGVIATPEIKQVRMQIHRLIDPLWQGGRFSRSEIYHAISDFLGINEYHTANVVSVEQAQQIIKFVRYYFHTM